MSSRHALELSLLDALGVPTENIIGFTIKGHVNDKMTVYAKYSVVATSGDGRIVEVKKVAKKFTLIEDKLGVPR